MGFLCGLLRRQEYGSKQVPLFGLQITKMLISPLNNEYYYLPQKEASADYEQGFNCGTHVLLLGLGEPPSLPGVHK
jgi:hypothetical protein